MANVLGVTGASSFGNEESLHQQVLASFPLCDMTEDDLRQNPQLCKLLATLAQHVDKTGLTNPLKTELKKAEQKLQSQRRRWLRYETLHRSLQEIIQEYSVQKHRSTVPPDQKMFYETMERCLVVTMCARQLDLSNTTKQDQPFVLGLTPTQNVQKIKQILPRELEEHLKKKCLSFLSYYEPECDNQSEGLKSCKLSHLSTQMDKDKKRVASLMESDHEKAVLLQRLTQLYLSEMTKCVQLLQSLILERCLTIQADLDKKKLEYFEGKCELVLQKIKDEVAGIQLDTYTANTISAHRKIRTKLESELQACQVEKQSVELKLSSFQILGKEFEALAEEYCKFREEIDMKSWALKEFTKDNIN